MGAPPSESGRFEEEGPQRTVSFARAFAVSKTPTTRAQYALFAAATHRQDPPACARMSDEGEWIATPGLTWRNPGFAQTGEHPVVCVSWDDAVAYASWLRDRTGKAYRLPTEAEFEYVARAGTTTPFPWGTSDTAICAFANSFDVSAQRAHPDWPAAACDDGYAFTAPVEHFPANGLGVFGMTGNAFQWTADCFIDTGYTIAPVDGTALSKEACEVRSIRGGSWLNGWKGLRSAMRDRDRPQDRYANVGFRVARSE